LKPTRSGTVVPPPRSSSGAFGRTVLPIGGASMSFQPVLSAASTSVLAGAERRQLRTSLALAQPTLLATLLPKPPPPATVRLSTPPVTVHQPTPWTAARLINPCERGDAINATVSNEPAELPNSVTRDGSPPKAAMLSCTHCRAASWSSAAYSPDWPPPSAVSDGFPMKPSTPSR